MIWNSEDCSTLQELTGQHQRGISCLAFSASGNKLASVGMDDQNSECHSSESQNLWAESTLELLSVGREHFRVVICGLRALDLFLLTASLVDNRSKTMSDTSATLFTLTASTVYMIPEDPS